MPLKKLQKKGKISIRFFLNHNLKARKTKNGDDAYPLYVIICLKRQKTSQRSTYLSYLTENDFSLMNKNINYHGIKSIKTGTSNVEKMILKERENILTVIEYLNPFNRFHFDIKEVVEYCKFISLNLTDVINDVLKDVMRLSLEEKSDNKIAMLYLRTLDWKDANCYDVYLVLWRANQLPFNIMEKFGRCFQLTVPIDIDRFSEDERLIISEISNKSMTELGIKITDKPLFYKSNAYNEVLNEISQLLSIN